MTGRVLVLRDERGQRLVAALMGRGIPAERFCPIEHEPLDFSPPDQVDWIIVTSATTVPMVAGRWPTAARVAAVGPATARALTSSGIQVDLVPALSSGAGILAAMPPGSGQRVWLPRSDLANPALPAGLRELGYDVIDQAVYRTRPVAVPPGIEAGLVAGDYAAVVVHSPSAVRALPACDVTAVAIGAPTTAALRDAGFRRVHTSQEPTDEALERAVLHVLTEQRNSP